MTINMPSPKPEVHLFSTSSAFLPDDGVSWRLPRRPQKARPRQFYDAFEERALFYDCFAGSDKDIVLIGPPALNLAPVLKAAIYRALPSRTLLAPSFFPSRSTMTTVLNEAPEGTTDIEVAFDDLNATLPVQPSQSEILKGRRVMFTMNKDNDLAWIETWARWHCQLHGVDAIVIFDNGSTLYRLEDISQTLSTIKGLKVIGFVNWPFRYGPVDPGVFTHPYWANFLQVASFGVMLRRFGRHSQGLLNCDIDELVGTADGKGVFTSLADSRSGYVKLKGRWIEAVSEPDTDMGKNSPSHFDFQYRRKNPLLAKCANKWALDPRAPWAGAYSVFPMMHRIYGMPLPDRLAAASHRFWHFKGISTNWKEKRAHQIPPIADAKLHIKDSNWLDAKAQLLETGHSTESGN